MATNLIGKRLGKYQIDSLLGSGNFASVYKATQVESQRTMAVKVLHAQLANNREFIRWFKEEAKQAWDLKHAKIVKVEGVYEQDDIHYIVMEYVDWGTLRSVLQHCSGDHADELDDETREDTEGTSQPAANSAQERDYQPPPLGIVAQITADICQALACAEQDGVVHCDLKPENILLSWQKDAALLGDFGIARSHNGSKSMPSSIRIGTIGYMSPEQIRGDPKLDGRSDIYALGIILYEMLTGHVPFVGETDEVRKMQLDKLPVPPSEVCSEISHELDRIVLKALAKEPQSRWSAEQLEQVIRQAVPLQPIRKLSEPPTSIEPPPQPHDGPAVPFFGQICTRCGFGFAMETEEGKCPACEFPLTKADATAERNRWDETAKAWFAPFLATKDLAYDAQVLEYKYNISKVFGERYNRIFAESDAVLAQGGIAPPTLRPPDFVIPTKLLATNQELLRMAADWEHASVDKFVIEDAAKDALKRQTWELRGRAWHILGLYHSLLACQSDTNSEMARQYEAAGRWYANAVESLQTAELGHLYAAKVSQALCELILRFPRDHSVVDTLKPQIEQLAHSSDAPTLKADFSVLKQYEQSAAQSQDTIARLRQEIRRHLEQGRQEVGAYQEKARAVNEQVKALSNLPTSKEIETAYQADRAYRRRMRPIARSAPWLLLSALDGVLLLFLVFSLPGFLPPPPTALRFIDDYRPILAVGLLLADFLVCSLLYGYLAGRASRSGLLETADRNLALVAFLSLVAGFVMVGLALAWLVPVPSGLTWNYVSGMVGVLAALCLMGVLFNVFLSLLHDPSRFRAVRERVIFFVLWPVSTSGLGCLLMPVWVPIAVVLMGAVLLDGIVFALLGGAGFLVGWPVGQFAQRFFESEQAPERRRAEAIARESARRQRARSELLNELAKLRRDHLQMIESLCAKIDQCISELQTTGEAYSLWLLRFETAERVAGFAAFRQQNDALRREAMKTAAA